MVSFLLSLPFLLRCQGDYQGLIMPKVMYINTSIINMPLACKQQLQATLTHCETCAMKTLCAGSYIGSYIKC
ncbi:hypothetical protein V8C37DRAFT_390408 [Trichoderma ceciliae]